MNQIMLIGFMGCGKTSVGRALAEALGLSFVDMDASIVEQAGMQITEIFAAYGETYFRRLETELLEELVCDETPMVISAGGGVPVQPQNHLLIKKIRMVVYLKTSVEILTDRLSNDTTRPVIQGGDLRQRILTLQKERNPVYEQMSDVQVVTDGKTITEIVQEIQNLRQECKK